MSCCEPAIADPAIEPDSMFLRPFTPAAPSIWLMPTSAPPIEPVWMSCWEPAIADPAIEPLTMLLVPGPLEPCTWLEPMSPLPIEPAAMLSPLAPGAAPPVTEPAVICAVPTAPAARSAAPIEPVWMSSWCPVMPEPAIEPRAMLSTRPTPAWEPSICWMPISPLPIEPAAMLWTPAPWSPCT